MNLSLVKYYIENILLHFTTKKRIFYKIYKNRLWGNSPSVSGTGSDLTQTRTISRAIPKLIKEYKILTLLDAPCGDFYWLKIVNLNIDEYIGLDIVPSIIVKNNKLYSHKSRQFITGNIITDPLPKVDLILCRDCLVHFSDSDAKKTIKNFQNSGATYLLTTTFSKHTKNNNIPTGRWRPINLQSSPFCFPKPLFTIVENCTEYNGEFSDKSLSLWKISTLPKY